MLTHSRLTELFYYDDGDLVRKVNKPKSPAGLPAGCQREDKYVVISVDGRPYLAHRLVFFLCNGYMPERSVDHIDRDPSNNRIENLRETSHSCNMKNRSLQSNAKSGVHGVGWLHHKKKWRARIKVNGLESSLGWHEEFIEAVAHRLSAEQCLGWGSCSTTSEALSAIKEYIERLK